MSKQIIYTGNIINLENNKQECLKLLLKLDKVETLKNDHVYRDNKRVIKILKYCDDGILTCKLTKEASKLGIGTKFLGYDIIYHKKRYDITRITPICIYLYTEYNIPVTRDINKKLVIELAKKIANTKLKFHPDFWYKNLILNKNNILVAIDWDGEMYRERRQARKLFSPHILVEKMLNYYKDVMLRTWPCLPMGNMYTLRPGMV